MIDGRLAIKAFWEINDNEVKKCIDATLFRPPDLSYFRGGGFSTDFTTRGEMPVTISRLNLIIKGLVPVLQIAEGETVELPDIEHNILDDLFRDILGKNIFIFIYHVLIIGGPGILLNDLKGLPLYDRSKIL